jgi:hypothetical protein
MVLRATKGHKDALGGSPRINGLERVFSGAAERRLTRSAH